MPLGATPSRWCVCQFHHFRAQNRFTFNYLLKTLLRGLPPVYPFFVTTFRHPGKKRATAFTGNDVTHGRLDVIVGRRVLQRAGVGMLLGVPARIHLLGETQVSKARLGPPTQRVNAAAAAHLLHAGSGNIRPCILQLLIAAPRSRSGQTLTVLTGWELGEYREFPTLIAIH